MPLFDFVCEQCGRKRFDALLPNGNVPVLCPATLSHGPMKRLPSAPSFTIKGFSEANGYNGGQEREMTKVEKAKIGVPDTTRLTIKS